MGDSGPLREMAARDYALPTLEFGPSKGFHSVENVREPAVFAFFAAPFPRTIHMMRLDVRLVSKQPECRLVAGTIVCQNPLPDERATKSNRMNPGSTDGSPVAVGLVSDAMFSAVDTGGASARSLECLIESTQSRIACIERDVHNLVVRRG